MIDRLHAMNVKLMVSVWSKIDPETEVGKQFAAKGYYIPGTQWVDFFNPAAAAALLEEFQRAHVIARNRCLVAGRYRAGKRRPRRKTAPSPAPVKKCGSSYPLLVNKTVYEGQRKDAPNKRVFILSRSAFLGQQRYASATWSGDIGNSWDTLKRQITAGLGLTRERVTVLDYGCRWLLSSRSDAVYRSRLSRAVPEVVPVFNLFPSATCPWLPNGHGAMAIR